ncbi:MAG: hypothetical protein HN411_05600 [Waddliaceae bacterium]|jgi:hypothetical protein|nr:hypothetical protein [Waddliaceae bacterium]MBT3578370.1 hypothetical protein [Waddliaceae bacterium]MBT4445557.1 hypothetical protein [Waddliaceae bacterium]MBT6929105.1 hypothetical protein [Waddliaceae bacterium]MBT7264409.1 hypothetical protein [Waddliaceae bacterium]
MTKLTKIRSYEDFYQLAGQVVAYKITKKVVRAPEGATQKETKRFRVANIYLKDTYRISKLAFAYITPRRTVSTQKEGCHHGVYRIVNPNSKTLPVWFNLDHILCGNRTFSVRKATTEELDHISSAIQLELAQMESHNQEAALDLIRA